MSIAENPYATPRSILTWMPLREPMFLVVAPRKFLLMMLLTLGGYFVYWLYRQWAFYQQATGKRLWPWVRVLFPACYFCSLILSVMHELEQGESAYHWWPRCLAVAISRVLQKHHIPRNHSLPFKYPGSSHTPP